MASEAVVSFLVERLGALLIKEVQLLHGVSDQFGWIQRELDSMRCFLKDADSKQKKDARVKNWVAQIRDVSYDAEDVMETFIYSQRRSRRGFVGRVKRYICILSADLRARHEVARQIENIRQNISDISRMRADYDIRNISEGRQEESSSSQSLQDRRRLFIARKDSESDLVVLQDEVDLVKKQLMTGEPRRCVISIFGMGGLGKTTLAKRVYHDVKEQFDCHAFIYLSQQFAIKEVLMRIIKYLMSPSKEQIEEIEKRDLEELNRMLQDDLKEKKYLVVIDDIWSIEDWEKIKLILPDGTKESRVILTTRKEEVASHADPRHRHEMRFLSSKEGWELFMKKIFPGEDPSTACPSELKGTGEKILEKCGGLPLPILVLGGLLRTKEPTPREWSSVLASVPLHLTQRYELCMEILALSYWDLPHHLKPCFLYFGLFPEDYEISSSKMIRLWIAEGFIQQKGNKVMEDVAEDYLEELVSRSMIQVASKRSNGSIKKCRIHDLLRELSISEAKENNFFTDTSSTSTNVRRLAVYRNIDADETKNRSISTLRSVLYFLDSDVDVVKLPNTSSKLLRVMNVDTEEHSIVSLPKEVGEFVHLKFLEFSRKFRVRSIPPSIGNLSSLQTLEVYADGPCEIPNTIWNLKELRHLQVHSDTIWNLKELRRPHLSNLKNLQTLSLHGGSWIEEGLGKLSNLRKLRICRNVGLYHNTLPCCIEKLRNLRSLDITEFVDQIPPFMPFTRHLDLYKITLHGRIEKLPEMPPNLVQLRLWKSKLEQDAISTVEKLQHLKILRLYSGSYLSKQMICSPGGFPRLELLELAGLPYLEEWIVEEGAMISLKSVKLFRMPKLQTETLPERVRAVLKKVNEMKKRSGA